MPDLFTLFGFIIATGILVSIAFPDKIFPEPEPEKKKVGSVYWGAYEGTSTECIEEAGTVEVQKAARKERVVAGSAMYAAGRGTSFRT